MPLESQKFKFSSFGPDLFVRYAFHFFTCHLSSCRPAYVAAQLTIYSAPPMPFCTIVVCLYREQCLHLAIQYLRTWRICPAGGHVSSRSKLTHLYAWNLKGTERSGWLLSCAEHSSRKFKKRYIKHIIHISCRSQTRELWCMREAISTTRASLKTSCKAPKFLRVLAIE